MASVDDVLKGNLRGYRRETGQPVEEIAVEEPAIDEVEPPQLYDERAEYRGFKVPAGMDAEQTERWFGAIDAREDEREAAEAEAEREAEAKFEAESGFSRQLLGSLERTVMKDNPRMGAKAIEGLGRVAGSQAMIDFGTKTAAEYDTSDDPASFTPRIGSIYDAEGFQDYIDYAGSTLGQGLGSIGTTIAGGVVGAGVGAAATAPFGGAGAAPGFRAGLLGSGFIQAYGSMYETLVDEQGVDPDIAAKYAIPFGVAMAVAERAGVEEVLKPARDQLSKNFAKRTAQLALRGGAAEGVTEGIQQVIQETAGEFSEVLGFASKDIDLGQRVRNTIESVIGGFLPGFTLGATGAARVRPEDDAPAPPAAPAAPEEIVSANMEEVPSRPVRVTAALTGVQDARPDLSRMKDMYLELSNEIAEAESKKQDASALKLDLDSLEVAIFGDFESSLRDILGRDGDIEIARFDRGIGGWAGQSLEPNLRVELVGDEATILSRLTEFNATSGMSGPDVVPQGGALNRVLVEALLDVPDVIASYDPENVEQNKKLVWYDNGAERLATLRIQLPPEMVTPQFLAGMGDVFAQDSLGFTVDRENSTIELIHTPEWSVTDAKQTLDSFVRAARLIQKVAQKRFGKDIGIEWLKERIEISEPSSGVKTVKNGFTEGESRYILKGYQELLKDEDRREARAPVRGEAPVSGRRSRPDEKDRVKPEARKRGVSVEATNDAVSEAAASNRSLSNLPTYEQFVFGGDGREGSFGLDRLHERAEQARSKVDDDVSRGLMSRMGLQFEDRDTSAELKIYPLQDKFGSTVNQVISRLKEWTDTEGTVGEGWTFTIFGPSFAKSGKKIGFIKPDFKNNGYAQKNAYIYQPYDPNGAFDDVAYTYAWRATHEIAHGLVNDKLTEQYGGQGRRAGALGILAIDDGGKNIMDPLSLSDALRALDWEHETFLKQREILEQDFGITISEDEFNREYMLNMSDAVHRVLTGRFSNPGELGAVPISEDPAVVLERAKDTVRQAARAMGMDMSERADGPSGNILIGRQAAPIKSVTGFGDLNADQAIDAMKKIETGKELMDFIINRADNPAYKVIASRIRPFLDKTLVATISDVEDFPRSIMLAIDDGDLEASTFNLLYDMSNKNTRTGTRGVTITTPDGIDIVLRGHGNFSGATAEVALHEAIHAATKNRIADGQLKQNKNTELGKATAELAALHKRVKKIIKTRKSQKGVPADPKLFDAVLEYGLEDLDEFVSYGMTNKTFQDFLMTIESENKSLWNTFVEKIANLLGIENQTVLTDLIRVTDQILSADVEELPARVRTRWINRMVGLDREEIPGAQYFSDEAFDLAQEEARPQGSRFIVGEIAVDDFLALAAEGMEEPKAKRVADLVEGGTKFNTLPGLEFDKSGKVITHEGRHRARALKELGVERMPILFESENIRWQKQSDPRERVEFPKFLIGQDSDFKIKFPFEQSVDSDSIRDIMDDLDLFEDDAAVQESMKKRVGSSDIDSMTDDQLANLFDQLMAGRIAASKVPKAEKLNRAQMKKLMDRYSAGTSQGAPEPLTRKAKKKDGSDIKPVTKATKLKTSAEGFRRGDARTELLDGRNPIDTDADWDQWWGGITGTDQVLEPPYKIRSYVDPQNIASELAKLTPEQKQKANEGINLVDEIGWYYKSGLITGDITAKLLAWSILSRSLSAFPHESAFLDAYISQPTYDMFQRDFGYFIEAALNGQFDERIAEEYDVWVGGVHRIKVCNKWLSEGVITQDEYDKFVGQHKPTIDALLADGVIDKKQAEGFLVDPESKNANEEHASARQLAETLRRDGKITDEQFRLLVGFHPALKIEGMGNPALSNLRDFGNKFLMKSSERVPKGQKLIGFKGQEYDFSGQTKLEAWHNILVDQEISGQEARRLYHQLYESAGIDNKVISFQLLVAGRTDVTVIDRIQANHFWDAAGGSLGKKVLYKDGTKIDLYEGFSTPSTDGAWQIWSRNPRPFSPARGLADVLSGVRGAILYEAIENSILRNLEEGYRLAGREGEASIGRFHWETWVINSGQEVGHDTLNVILKELRGEADPAVGAFVREGKFQMRRYGMKYVVLPGNETAMVMETQDGQNYLFNRSQWANLSDKLKKDGSNVKTGDLPRIVPRGWRLTNERFENTPWYNRASVSRDNLDIAIREFGTPATDEQSLAIQRFADRAGVDDTTGVGEQGNPLDTVGPVILSQRVDSPVDMVVMYTDDVSRSKAELDRRRKIANKYDPMLFELMKMEADFYEMDDRSEEAKALGNQYEDLLKQYANIDDELFADEHERFLKGDDFYYETMEEGLEDFDVDRAFNVMTDAQDIEMDIDLRRTQEMMQRKRFDRMMDRGGTLVDLAGKNSPINRLIIQKAKAFNHPVQTVQLIESDKMQLQQDLSNVEELKEDGLISYLLYKELKGDVMLF